MIHQIIRVCWALGLGSWACTWLLVKGKREELQLTIPRQMENPSILRDWFDRVDSSNSGSITATQLKRALSVGNLEFPLSVVQQMIRMYDYDRNGTMSFDGGKYDIQEEATGKD
ncbi:hypothetical protein GIB67_038267 [Kingdonia uniflora]|uniref:EF-hand domain-containing protein n=1 Tax=Kingdonia uniflora TaxID=39325 RepID=A0A7J7MS83_9MAGN|nr:hypothetical protein GIB67_038267 [Kingdonia uniflora]